MLRVLPTLVLLGLTIYAVVDCIQTEESRQRNLPKAALAAADPALPPRRADRLVPGRPARARRRGRGTNRPPYPRGPDDDPDFLRNL